MKRILSILTLCAVLVPALVSCNNDKGGGKAKDIKFDTPKYVDDALLIKLPTGDAIECTTDVLREMTDITLPPVKAGGSIHITGLETTEAGKVFVDAMIDLIPTEDYSKFKKHKKDANGNLLFRVEGTFVGSKDKFDIKDKKGTKKVAEVVLKATKASSKMSLTFTVGGESQTVVANVTTANKPSGLLANLCMSFKVHRTVIDVDGVGGNWWDGCDLVTTLDASIQYYVDAYNQYGRATKFTDFLNKGADTYTFDELMEPVFVALREYLADGLEHPFLVRGDDRVYTD